MIEIKSGALRGLQRPVPASLARQRILRPVGPQDASLARRLSEIFSYAHLAGSFARFARKKLCKRGGGTLRFSGKQHPHPALSRNSSGRGAEFGQEEKTTD